MNILLLNWRDPYHPRSGGAEQVTLSHAKGWVSKGDKVTWFSAQYPGVASEETVDGIHYVRRGSHLTVFFYAVIYYVLHRDSTDLIVDQVHGIPFFSIFYSKKPIVLFLHEVAGGIWHVMYRPPWSWIGLLLERWYLWLYRNTAIWTDAESTVDDLVRMGVSRDHCIAIPCPISNSPLDRKPHKNSVPTYIYVGRIVRMKQIEDILRAFSQICTVLPDARLWLVGSGDVQYIHFLKNVQNSLGFTNEVIWYGKVSDSKKLLLMRKAHVLLHTSVKEGWGLVVLEAGSQWTPSVVYKTEGLVDTVRHGKTGRIVHPRTPENLARTAMDLICDSGAYRRLQKGAYLWSKKFVWSDAVAQSNALLRSIYDR